jgi:hypothetical protein
LIAIRLSTGLRTGELAGLRLFTERVAPLVSAARAGDDFVLMAHLRATSPLLKRSAINATPTPDDPLLPIRSGVEALLGLDLDGDATFFDVFQCVAEHQLSRSRRRYERSLSPHNRHCRAVPMFLIRPTTNSSRRKMKRLPRRHRPA